MPERPKCAWCGKNRKPSNWEQETREGIWKRLCEPCANRRLNNPWSALLPMRKVSITERRRTGSEQRQRTSVIAVRLLPTERAALQAAANQRGVSISELVRASALTEAQAVGNG